MKKIAAAGIIAAAAGGILLGALPAQADDVSGDWPGAAFWQGPSDFQVVPVQICRGIDVDALNDILGTSDESGPCVNGPVVHDTATPMPTPTPTPTPTP
ncbi:MAG TPA: hypothetical protein VNW94_08760 [Streptosporangiaceae bacterium]|nr:hypothetical protein [Streptosporangiaceae bacterium]